MRFVSATAQHDTPDISPEKDKRAGFWQCAACKKPFSLYIKGISKDKQGKFNFDPILESPMFKANPEEEQKEEENTDKEDEKTNPLDLLLNSTQLHNCNITYIDEQSDLTVTLSKTTFDMKKE